jgi:hypothetical protein
MELEVAKELEELHRELARQRELNRELEVDLNKLREDFEGYLRLKQKEESQRLRTALIAAGGVIIALGGFVWWEIIWPVIKTGQGR